MKISYNWLNKIIDIQDLSPDKVSEILTNTGLEVEGVEEYNSVEGGLEGLIVGKVIEIEKHPDADKLKVTKVDIGEKELLQIICGAPNVAQNQKVIVAPIGCTLYPKEHDPIKIKKAKIRGIESEGMICSTAEIGIDECHEGIYVFDESKNIAVGTPVKDLFEIYSDSIFEIGLTPNRGDATSHLGVARDLNAFLQKDLKQTQVTHIENIKANKSIPIQVKVEDFKACPRYCGIALKVEVKPSPAWLSSQLESIGVKSINNVVDITNYVLHELGNPLHAFDMDKIHKHTIVVKKCKSGTKFVTLDETERELHTEDLMICDDEKPMCIGGIFGGLDSGVSEKTQNIFLECAYFDPTHVRKSANRHKLKTDASFRFERGVDISSIPTALGAAVDLMTQLCNAEVISDFIDITEKAKGIPPKNKVSLSFDYILKMIGYPIEKSKILNILKALDFEIVKEDEKDLELLVPYAKSDVTRPCDVVEEILRIYGFNNIPISPQLRYSQDRTSQDISPIIRNELSHKLSGLGFSQIMTNPIGNKNIYENPENLILLANSTNSDLNSLRKSMLYSSLEIIRYNIFRKNEDLKFFEFGKTYEIQNGNLNETEFLTFTITGNKQTEQWNHKNNKVDFFYLKGLIDNLLQHCVPNLSTSSSYSENREYEYGLQYTDKANSIIADFGRVSAKECAKYDLKNTPVFFGKIAFHTFKDSYESYKNKLSPIPKTIAIRRDLSLYIEKHITFDQLLKESLNAGGKNLRDVNIFDVYDDKKNNKLSYALNFTIQDFEKTLTDKDINKIMDKIIVSLEKIDGLEIRK